MNILIGADVVPTEPNIKLFNEGNTKKLLGDELNNLWHSADFRVFNLETPLTNISSPIKKVGPNLQAPLSTVAGIKKLNPSIITVANNHIFDHGVNGLKDTIEELKNNNLDYIGAGDNLLEASKSHIFQHDNIKIGIYACAENEFSIAKDNYPGANPFDPLESLDHIANLKKECDYVIVLYHGGIEHYRYPSPYLQKVCRKIVQKGANLVICQHSHCIGCFEKFKEATIVYGQGNFIFNKYDNEFWRTALLVDVTIDNSLQINYIPIIKEENRVRLAVGKEADEILTAFQIRSNEILQNGFIEESYGNLAQQRFQTYLRTFSGFNKWKSRIDRKLMGGALLRRRYDKNKLLAINNYIECEAHRELVLAALKGEQKIERQLPK